MSTVLSTSAQSHEVESVHKQKHEKGNYADKHIYSELFKDNLSISSSIQESDINFYNVIVNAVNTAKIKSISSFNCGPKSRSMPKFKNPCGICKKSANDNHNQKAIFCITCLRWIHKKCNGTTFKECNKLEAEDENIPWQCILCDIDDMASKFSFTYLSEMELNGLYGLDIPSQLKLLSSYELKSKLTHIPSLDSLDLD